MLVCSKCGLSKDESEFHKKNGRKRGYAYSCKECFRKYNSNHYENNKALRKTQNASWYKENRVKRIQQIEQYKKDRRRRDAEFKVRGTLRCMVYRVSKGTQSMRTMHYIGCTTKEFMDYISKLFLPGMTWGNHGFGPGYWVFDHIKPIAAFDLYNEEELLQVNHYTNLQPLWFEENAQKSDTYVETNQTNPLDLPTAPSTNPV